MTIDALKYSSRPPFAAVTCGELQEEILRMAPLINLSWHDYLDQAAAFEPGYVVDMGAARKPTHGCSKRDGKYSRPLTRLPLWTGNV